MAHRANSPALDLNRLALEFRSVDRRGWQSHIEPMLAELAGAAGSRLRRHRAKIGQWVLEYVGDDETACQFFSHHWPAARAGEIPDSYCYHFGEAPSGDSLMPPGRSSAARPDYAICPENSRAFLRGTRRYAQVYEACCATLQQLAARSVRLHRTGRLQRPSDAWLLLRAACVEYQPSTGATRTVALLGDRHTGKSVHSYGLCLAKIGNSWISDDLTAVHLGAGTVHRTESQLWWPTSMVGTYPHLAPFFATSATEALQISVLLGDQIHQYRDASDLTRAVERGLVSEDSFVLLTDQLSRADNACGMLDAHELLGPDHCIEQSLLTDAISISHDANSRWIVRALSGNEFVSRSISTGVGTPTDECMKQTTEARRACLEHLLNESNVRAAWLNLRLPAAQTQFCLRHYLEGASDSIQLLAPDDFADSTLQRTMHLEARAGGDGLGRSGPNFFHGTRTVNLVSFERAGSRAEVVAFDPFEDGYAQVRSVWPGQVADFFSRHASLRVRELFTETRNSPPQPASITLHLPLTSNRPGS